MHIHHLALRVRDFEKSLHVYQTLTELKIHTQLSANGGSIAYLQHANGETQLELIGMPEGETVKASGMFLCFGTEDIASAHERAVLHGMNPSDIRQPEPDARQVVGRLLNVHIRSFGLLGVDNMDAAALLN